MPSLTECLKKLGTVVSEADKNELLSAELLQEGDITDKISEMVAATDRDLDGIRAQLTEQGFDVTKPIGTLQQASAFHGTPHDILGNLDPEQRRFMLDNIGTGEGAQAFGHGLYFTSEESIANWYAERLTGGVNANVRDAIDSLDWLGFGSRTEALKNIRANEDWADRWDANDDPDVVAELNNWRTLGQEKRVFNVTLWKDKQENLLKWNDSVSPGVAEAIDKQLEAEGSDLRLSDFNPGLANMDTDAIRQVIKTNDSDADIDGMTREELIQMYDDMELEGWTLFESGAALYSSLSDEFHSDKAASEFLNRAGIDGISFPAQSGGRGDGSKGTNYVVFDDAAIEIEEQILLQQEGGEVRGVFDVERNIVGLYKINDASTFIHEIFHFFAKDLKAMAKMDGVDSDLLNDIAILEKYAGASLDSVEAQEKLARAFTRYMGSGKAPSVGLQGVFESFKDWLLGMWDVVSSSFEYSDEVGGVFDRMLASQEDMEMANAMYSDMVTLTSAMEDILDSDEERASLAKAKKEHNKANQDARVSLLALRMTAWKRARGGIRGIRAQVKKDLSETERYKAVAYFEPGRSLNANELSKQDIDHLKSLGKSIVTKKGGTTLDAAAMSLGIASGQELLASMRNTKPINEAVTEETAERVRKQTEAYEREIESLSGADWKAQLAEESLHSEAKMREMVEIAKILAMKALKSQQGALRSEQRKLTHEAVKLAARKVIYDMDPSKARATHKFLLAEKRYLRMATNLALKGDYEGAYSAMKKATLQNAMSRESKNFRKMQDSLIKRTSKKRLASTLDGSDEMAKVEELRADAVRQLVGQYIHKDIKPKVFDNALKDLVAQDMTDDAELIESMAPASLILADWMIEGTPIVKAEDWYKLDNAISHLVKIGRGQLDALKTARFQSREQLIMGMLAQLGELKSMKIRGGDIRSWQNFLGSVLSDVRRADFIMDELDGFRLEQGLPPGLFVSTFVNTINEKEGDYGKLMLELDDAMKPHLVKLTEASRRISKEMGTKVGFGLPGFDGEASEFMVKVGELEFTTENLIAILLNLGNPDTRAMVMSNPKGHNFSPKMIDKISSLFNADELKAVQGLLNVVASKTDKLDKVAKDVTGRSLVRVDTDSGYEVKSKDGETIKIEGYYPISHGSQYNRVSAAQSAREMAMNSIDAVFRSNTVKGSMLIERMRDKDGNILVVRPVSLSLSTYRQHVSDMARLITHQKLMSEIAPVFHDARIEEAITNVIGPNGYKTMIEALQGVARPGGTKLEPRKGYLKVMNWVRKKGGALALTPRVSSSIKQALSTMNGLSELSKFSKKTPIYYAQAVKQFAKGGKVSDLVAFVDESDPSMMSRGNTLDMNLNDLTEEARAALPVGVTIPGTNRVVTMKDVQDAMYYGIKTVDYATTYPIWLAAYNMALTENIGGVKETMTPEEKKAKAIDFARLTVSRTQPSSAPLALTAVQRNEFMKFFTSFMTFTLGVHGQRMINSFKAVMNKDIPPSEYIKTVVLEGLAPVYLQMAFAFLVYSDDERPEWSELFIEPVLYMTTSWLPIVRDVPTMAKYNISNVAPTFAQMLERIWYPLDETLRWDDAGEIVYEWGKTAGAIAGVNVLNFTDDIGKMYKKTTGKDILGK